MWVRTHPGLQDLTLLAVKALYGLESAHLPPSEGQRIETFNIESLSTTFQIDTALVVDDFNIANSGEQTFWPESPYSVASGSNEDRRTHQRFWEKCLTSLTEICSAAPSYYNRANN